MSETINGSPTFSNSHTVPTAGQLVSAAAHKGYAQSLANNDKWIYDKLIAGVDRVRSVANLAALQALTGMVDGDVANCVSLGFFRFHATDATSANSVTIVAPGVGSGRWRHVAVDLRAVANGLAPLDANSFVPAANLKINVANGIAGLDGNAKVPSAQLPWRLVDEFTGYTSNLSLSSINGWTQLISFNIGLGVSGGAVAGDILNLTMEPAVIPHSGTDGTTVLEVRSEILDGLTNIGTTIRSVTDIGTATIWTRNVNLPVIQWTPAFIVGTTVVKLEARVTGAGFVDIGPSILRVKQWRP